MLYFYIISFINYLSLQQLLHYNIRHAYLSWSDVLHISSGTLRMLSYSSDSSLALCEYVSLRKFRNISSVWLITCSSESGLDNKTEDELGRTVWSPPPEFPSQLAIAEFGGLINCHSNINWIVKQFLVQFCNTVFVPRTSLVKVVSRNDFFSQLS